MIPYPDCGFRTNDLVQVMRDREPAIFRGLVIPASGAEPFARLQPFTGGGLRFVRISQVEAYDPQEGLSALLTPEDRTLADRVEAVARRALQWEATE
jgi:hypothetical protein